MSTETNSSLEDMLDASETTEAAPAPSSPPPETGVNDSTAPPADAPATAPSEAETPHVPRKALEDERRKRQEYERKIQEYEQYIRAQQQRPQPQAPQLNKEDIERLWFENPVGAAAIVQQQAVQQAYTLLQSRELDRHERRARKTYGDEAVDTALQLADRAGMKPRFLQEDDAYQAMMEWYKEIEIIRDPQSAKERLRAEVLAEYGISNAAPKPAAPAAVPKSLASRTSSQPRAPNGQFQGRASLDELLG